MKTRRTTNLSAAILIPLFVWTLASTGKPAWASCRVHNISLERKGGLTRLSVHANKAFEFVHSTEEAKDGRPYRVIIDCKDALFDLPQKNFQEGLPSGIIQAIRTSQFQAVPERIVRVVLDLKGPADYKLIDTEEKNKATVAIVADQDSDFPMWMAVTQKVEGSRALSSTSDKQASQSAFRTEVQEQRKTTAVEGPVVSKQAPVRRRITRSSAPAGPFPKEESTLQTDTEKSRKQKVSLATVKPHGDRTFKRMRITLSRIPLGPFPLEEVVAGATAQDEVNLAEAGRRESASDQSAGTVVGGISKLLGPESVVARETQMVPESLTVSHEMQQTELHLVPQRQPAVYDPGRQRDPFVPLTDRQDMTFGAVPLPLFENLKLVGILRDQEGNRALLEDKMGFGHILMRGDRIRDGYVISVGEDAATFHVEEYGGYRVVVLELYKEY
jgi:hypothetical protein